jgi:hypothetical protein
MHREQRRSIEIGSIERRAGGVPNLGGKITNSKQEIREKHNIATKPVRRSLLLASLVRYDINR